MKYSFGVLALVLLSAFNSVLADAVDFPPGNNKKMPEVGLAAAEDYGDRQFAAWLPYFPSDKDHGTFEVSTRYTLFVLIPESFGPGATVKVSVSREDAKVPIDAEVLLLSEKLTTHFPLAPDGILRIPDSGASIMLRALPPLTVKFEKVPSLTDAQ